jgi:hypothetical protein
MRSLRSRVHAVGLVAAGALLGGLLVGGAWYATSTDLTDGLLRGLTGRAAAQEALPPMPAKPANATDSRRPTGEVTQITFDPATFTLRAADGAETTFRVLDTTVFMAGRDRPYRFDLLKQGDHVTVRGGGAGKAVENAQAAPPAGSDQGKTKQARAAGQAGTPDGEPIARQVQVHPAGEKGKKGKDGQAASLTTSGTNGGSDATRQ